MSKNPFAEIAAELEADPRAGHNIADTKLLGILGGLGPMASVYFYELVTRHTKAEKDQDHLDIVLSSKATTPDRTATIVGGAPFADPVPVMQAEAKRLQDYGAQLLAIACNTAHYFFRQVTEAVEIPVLNMVALTVDKALALGCKKVGILATDGTVLSQTYQMECVKKGLECIVPELEGQSALMAIIYEQIKAGRPVDMDAFNRVVWPLFEDGCDKLILGCTELSLIKRDGLLEDEKYLDSMEALAEEAITQCGKQPVGFSWPVV